MAAAALAGLGAFRRPPNFILILTDDQGYNDLGCYYTPPNPEAAYGAIRTPALDQLAREGVRLTDFYVGAAVCTPSRAALLTGCYPPRIGFGAKRGVGVLTPRSRTGLSPTEETIARRLKQHDYATACVGKWHLGHHPPFHPLSHGFDTFFGIPWSANQRPLHLFRDHTRLRRLDDEPVLVDVFTRRAMDFVTDHRDQPFFLYLAYSAPHEPWAVLPEYQGRSARGRYGDVIEMVDAHVGKLVDHLDRLGLTEQTLIVFTSDNGPWLEGPAKPSAHPLRGGKATAFEGGFRSPCLWRWPGVLPAKTVRKGLVTALDLLPTFLGQAGVRRPVAPIDGHDAWAVLADGAPSPTEHVYYYARGRLEAVRNDRFKWMFPSPRRRPPVPAALFDLEADIGETTDVKRSYPEQVARLRAAARRMRGELGDSLRGIQGRAVRPIGRV
ncbi:MAG: sulfatase-like hydrolase/transferase [Myxococcota bacterium]